MLLLCKACGWIEQPKAPPSTTSTATRGLIAGIKAASWLLGGTITLLGYYLKGVGAVAVAFGLATWWVFGMGLIIAGLGWVTILLSRIVIVLGRILKPGGGGSTKQCPSCGGTDLIPSTSPVGRKLISELGVEVPIESENPLPKGQRFLSYAFGLFVALALVVWLPYKFLHTEEKHPENSPAVPASAQVVVPRPVHDSTETPPADQPAPTESEPVQTPKLIKTPAYSPTIAKAPDRAPDVTITPVQASTQVVPLDFSGTWVGVLNQDAQRAQNQDSRRFDVGISLTLSGKTIQGRSWIVENRSHRGELLIEGVVNSERRITIQETRVIRSVGTDNWIPKKMVLVLGHGEDGEVINGDWFYGGVRLGDLRLTKSEQGSPR
jgi:hypothetical protein